MIDYELTPQKEEEIRPYLSQLYNASSDFMEVSYKQKARVCWDYYHARLPEIPHDSIIPAIDRTCHSVVNGALKDLIEIFTSGEDAVSFAPLSGEDAYTAKSANELVNQIFLRDNDGKALLQDAIKTALVESACVIKRYWSDDEIETKTVSANNIASQEEAEAYIIGLQDSGVEIDDENVSLVENEDGTVNLTLTYRIKRERVKVEIVPIEEFLIEPHAKSIQDANYTCHRVLKTKEQLKHYGLTDDEISEINDDDSDLSAWTIHAARTNGMENFDDDNGVDTDDYAFKCWLREHHWRTDKLSEDKSVRQYFILQAGDGKIIKVVEESEHPFDIINPMPLANSVFGESFMSTVIDLQCDRAWAKQALATYAFKCAVPNMQAVAGGYDRRSLLNPKPGTIVEVEAMGNVQMMPMSTLPPLDAMFALTDQEKEERTGINNLQQGLTTNALETSRMSESSVNNMITLSTGRVRSLAHCIANGGYASLFRAIYRLYKDNSTKPVNVLTAYGVQQIQPNQLPDRTHLNINVALTTQEKAKRAANLNQLLDWIMKVQSAGGMFMQPAQQAFAISEMSNYLGFPNVYDFSVPPQQIQAPQPDPMAIAQIGLINAQAQREAAQAGKLIGEDHIQGEELLFKQQLAGKQEMRADQELNWRMEHAADQMRLAQNQLAVNANTEALKAQHTNERQAVETFKAQTANLKVQSDIIKDHTPKAKPEAITG